MKRLYLFALCLALLTLTLVPLNSQSETNARSIDIIRTLDSDGGVGGFSSIAIGSNGNPVITYWDQTNEDLKLVACGDATCDPLTNTIRTLDSQGIVGEFASIAIGSNGNPVISYFDFTNADLKLVVCDDPTCNPATNLISAPDSFGNTGYATSIAIGSNGNPVISYTNSIGDLRVAACSSPTCDTGFFRTLDSVSDVSSSTTSIAIGSNGNPIISYFDDTNDDLKLVACGDPSCNPVTNITRTLDRTDNDSLLGFDMSIAIGSNGNPVISYFDDTNDDLKLVACGDPTCAPVTNIIRTLDSDGFVGFSSSIAIGSNGNPVISYSSIDNVKLVTCGDPTCDPATNTLRILDSQGVEDGFTSIAIDPDGVPVISYYDWLNTDLKFAYADSVRPQTVTRVYPSSGETLTGAMKSVVWGAIDGIEWYNLRISDASNTPILDGWVEAAQVCDQDDLCAVYGDSEFLNFPAAILNGDYQLSFATYDLETETLAPLDAPTTFTVAVPAPAAPVILAPQAVPSTQIRTIDWELDPTALWYNVAIRQVGTTISDDWYYAPDVCSTAQCSVEAPVLLAGAYTLTVSAWGPGVTGTNYPNSVTNFTVTNNIPANIVLTSPSANATVGTDVDTLEWADDINAFWYRVAILNTRAGIVSEQWFSSADICTDGVCSIPADLVPGTYSVRIAAWGPANEIGPSTTSTFTVTE